MRCSKCHKEETEWDDLCQTCWEAYCSEEWWRLKVWQNGVTREDIRAQQDISDEDIWLDGRDSGRREVYKYLKIYPPDTTSQEILDDLRVYSPFRWVL